MENLKIFIHNINNNSILEDKGIWSKVYAPNDKQVKQAKYSITMLEGYKNIHDVYFVRFKLCGVDGVICIKDETVKRRLSDPKHIEKFDSQKHFMQKVNISFH